jgi:porphobilinogen deaminase
MVIPMIVILKKQCDKVCYKSKDMGMDVDIILDSPEDIPKDIPKDIPIVAVRERVINNTQLVASYVPIVNTHQIVK